MRVALPTVCCNKHNARALVDVYICARCVCPIREFEAADWFELQRHVICHLDLCLACAPPHGDGTRPLWLAAAANKRKGGEGDEATTKKQAVAKAVAVTK